jgi:peptide/nickel transport system substrate-binding protein
MKTFSVILAFLLILSLGLAACAPGPAPKPVSPAPATSATPAPAPAPAPTPTSSPAPAPKPGITLTSNNLYQGAPKTGGILRFTQSTGPSSWDPHQRPAWAGGLLVPIYNNLVQINPEFKEVVSANIIGDLASSWTISPDGMKYTFNLAKNAKWHDGKPFTADDVIYSFDKMLDIKGGSRVATTIDSIASYVKTDDFTVVVTTKYPTPGLLVNLAGAYAVIEPRHKAGTDAKSTDFLVGTGPFKFKSYIPESEYHLVRNPDYFKKDKLGNPLPYLEGLSIYFMRTIDGGVGSFGTFKLDMYNPIQILYTKDDVGKMTAQAPNSSVIVNRADAPFLIYINSQFKPFQDPKVRKAMQLVFNSEDQLLARVGDLKYGQPGRGIFARVWANSEADVAKLMGWSDASGKAKPYDQRIKEAQQLMKESGYPDGFTFRMVYAAVANNHSEPSFTQYADILRKNLNIRGELKPYANNVDAYKARDAGDYDMYNEMLYAATPDPDSYMAYFKTGGSTNFMKYSNPEVDKLFDAQTREMDVVKRQEMLRKIEALLLTDMAVMPGAFLAGNLYMHPWVKNFNTTNATYGPDNKLELVWMDGQPK